MIPTYNRQTFAEALRSAGVLPGDVMFSHSNIAWFGWPDEGRTAEQVCGTIFGAIEDALGPEGTLVVPTFSYSFCKGEPFDPVHTPSACGALSEFVRQRPNAERSHDPIFSVAAVGRRARELTADISPESFGADSFWERFLNCNGLICNMNLHRGSTFFHYVERCLQVPYRFDKVFRGTMIVAGQPRTCSSIFFCHDLSNPQTQVDPAPFDQLARDSGLSKTVAVGRGVLVSLRAADTFRLIAETLPRNPWLLTAAANAGESPPLIRRMSPERPVVKLSAGCNPGEIVRRLAPLPRDLVSDGLDDSLRMISEVLPLAICEFPTGTRCAAGLVPEKWTCRDARLETIDGRVIFAQDDNLWHVARYSPSFAGELGRDELLAHLESSSRDSDDVPRRCLADERRWLLCCAGRTAARLTADRYRVSIDSVFSLGTLKVGEATAAGASHEEVILSACLSLSPTAAHDLYGAALGICVLRELQNRIDLRYTYRLVLMPDIFGRSAFEQQDCGIPRSETARLCLDEIVADGGRNFSSRQDLEELRQVLLPLLSELIDRKAVAA